MPLNTHRARRFAVKPSLIVLAVVQAALAGDTPLIHIRNFGQVNEHIYRGAEPTEEGLRELAAIHVTLDIDLREAGGETEAERRIAQGLGMQYINVPMRGMAAPSKEQVERVLGLIVPEDSGRIFVHCRRGKDRTGTIVACYRVQHDGWDNRKAQQEANSYGMSWAERGMRSFVLKFKPMDLPAAKAAQ